MSAEQGSHHELTEFAFERKPQHIKFVEKVAVTEGVVCDVYFFVGDETKDLGIITIQPGCSTPRQLVLGGSRTIEGYISGRGELIIDSSNGEKEFYPVDDSYPGRFQVDVNVGDVMQWLAEKDSSLVVYEICFPPYKDGRYQDL